MARCPAKLEAKRDVAFSLVMYCWSAVLTGIGGEGLNLPPKTSAQCCKYMLRVFVYCTKQSTSGAFWLAAALFPIP